MGGRCVPCLRSNEPRPLLTRQTTTVMKEIEHDDALWQAKKRKREQRQNDLDAETASSSSDKMSTHPIPASSEPEPESESESSVDTAPRRPGFY